jgi:hypothetical protein
LPSPYFALRFESSGHHGAGEVVLERLLTSQLPEVRVVSTLVSSSVSDTNDPGDFADFASRNEDRITTESAQMLSASDLIQLSSIDLDTSR